MIGGHPPPIALLNRSRALVAAALLVIVAAWEARPESQAVAAVTSPLQAFGARIGDDYFLATYTELEQYWKRLDRESDRLTLVDIGRTEEGRTQWMAVVSSPDNIARLDRYRTISRRLALAEGLSDEEARSLAADGKTTGVRNVFDGDAHRQYEALWHYIQTLPPPTPR